MREVRRPGLVRKVAALARRAVVMVWPDNCPLCGNAMHYGETPVCVECLVKLPRIGNDRKITYVGAPNNEIIERSWFLYNHEDPSHKLIHDIKYHDRRNFARKLGREFAMQKLLDDIPLDIILPIPLHWTKQFVRGYNQSMEIALGVSDVLPGVAVKKNLYARRPHDTQTQRSYAERNENVKDVFAVRKPESLDGRHVAILDDVITTRATMFNAMEAILNVSSPASVSFLSLARTEGGR